MRVSGPACTIPNGTAAAGKVWPVPPVPTMGFTHRDCEKAETAHSTGSINRYFFMARFCTR